MTGQKCLKYNSLCKKEGDAAVEDLIICVNEDSSGSSDFSEKSDEEMTVENCQE